MPAEWEPHRATLMAFCGSDTLYRDDDWRRFIRDEQQNIIRKIVDFEPVVLFVRDVQQKNEAEQRYKKLHNLEIRILKHCDIWTRDSLPSFVIEDERYLDAVDWNFNVWGESEALINFRSEYAFDRDFAERMTRLFERRFSLRRKKSNIVAEGGAIDTDGQGIILTTESVLLHRNPPECDETKEKWTERIETELKRVTGAQEIIWLPGSADRDDYTRGHIDGIARFVGPGHVLFEMADEAELSPQQLTEQIANREAITSAVDKGLLLKVTEIRSPRRAEMKKQHVIDPQFAGVYINFVFVNGGIIIPGFGDEERDEEAQNALRCVYPNREVVPVQINDIANAGGGIHCATQSMPLTGTLDHTGTRTGVTFKLQPDPKVIDNLAQEYIAGLSEKDRELEKNWLKAGQSLLRGQRNSDEDRKNVFVIHKWKTRGRGFSRVEDNTNSAITQAAASSISLQSNEDEARKKAINAWVDLRGVGVPVASAILAAIHPDKFTVIDFRALEALGVRRNAIPSVEFYLDYLDCCLDLVRKLNIEQTNDATALRILDRALWQWSKNRG
jgi:agmatine deiminase